VDEPFDIAPSDVAPLVDCAAVAPAKAQSTAAAAKVFSGFIKRFLGARPSFGADRWRV
jgi:hypothetical protein